MSSKHKAIITLTITKEVELDSEKYYTDSAEDMLEMEKQFAYNMPDDWMNNGEWPRIFVEGKLLVNAGDGAA